MNEIILGLVRHALTVAGGALASRGFIEASQAEIAAGAVVALIGVAASVISKLRAKKK